MTAFPAFREGVATTPDDIGLAFRVYGLAGPFLVCTNGLGVSTFFWEAPGHGAAPGFAPAFGARHRVVVWDFVGHGRSSDARDPNRATIAAFARDLATVMDAAGAEQAVLFGHSLGAQVNFEFYAQAPARVLALVPTLGTYGKAIESFFGMPRAARLLARLGIVGLPRTHRLVPALMDPLIRSTLIERSARLFRLVDPKAPSMAGYFEHLGRLDYRVFASLLSDLGRHDATDILPTIRVPTLVVGADRDLFVPPSVARKMASLIPGAELEILSRGTHAALFEQSARYQARVERFLRERVLPG
ncbi:MAG: alpha/beta fold hydrolase [Deltaproteobacteria bacterium]